MLFSVIIFIDSALRLALSSFALSASRRQYSMHVFFVFSSLFIQSCNDIKKFSWT
uniref:Uncharacterized protein n=1 Tax=Klebsiella pneumoniae TaxID=573 RepID=A0A5P1PKY7_KLEPN|nr:hypothetical protein [Klebsiella pneumoniae]QEQ70441.1 hypothetical protein [Klebsiella pneumoniae]